MFVCMAYDESKPPGSFTCQMKFEVKDVDEATGEPDEEGYEDEYQVCTGLQVSVCSDFYAALA